MTKKVAFILILILGGTVLALAGVEGALRWWQGRVAAAEHMDDGLLRYDRQLGWRLSPGWSGRHRHYDFDTSYTVNGKGLRRTGLKTAGGGGDAWAFVGDSFTFGIGVDDQQTFCSLLEKRSSDLACLNFAVPGYSTDQQLLLIRERVAEFRPAKVFLVTCLINDLFDNALPIPVQGTHSKPYFTIDGDRLALENVPVPPGTKPASQIPADFAAAVFGNAEERESGPFGWLRRFALGRKTLDAFSSGRDPGKWRFAERFAGQCELYARLLSAMNEACREMGSELVLVLLSGKTHLSCVI